LVALISTINIWTGVENPVWEKYWTFIDQYVFTKDDNKPLIVDISFLLEVIETLSKYNMSEFYCCQLEVEANKVNLFLDLRYNPIAKLLTKLIPCSEKGIEYIVSLILTIIIKNPSHCLVAVLVKVIIELGNLSEVCIALKKFNWLVKISRLVPSLKIDIIILCLRLCQILITNEHKGGYELNEIKDGIKLLLYKFYKPYAKEDMTEDQLIIYTAEQERLCKELITWITSHEFYKTQVTFITKS